MVLYMQFILPPWTLPPFYRILSDIIKQFNYIDVCKSIEILRKTADR